MMAQCLCATGLMPVLVLRVDDTFPSHILYVQAVIILQGQFKYTWKLGSHHANGRKVECLRLTPASDYGPGRPSMMSIQSVDIGHWLMSRVQMAPVGLGTSRKVLVPLMIVFRDQ